MPRREMSDEEIQELSRAIGEQNPSGLPIVGIPIFYTFKNSPLPPTEKIINPLVGAVKRIFQRRRM